MTIKTLLNSTTANIVYKIQLPIALVIYLYLGWSNAPAQTSFNYPDWLMHFIGNVLLYASFWLALLSRIKSWALLLGLIPFSAAVELGQYLNPHRSVDPMDMLANLCGLLLGFLLCKIFEKVFL